MSVRYTDIEAAVAQLLNALKAGTVSSAETSYRAVPKLPDEHLTDAAFPPTAVRQAIVEAVMTIASFLCAQESNPLRTAFRLVQAVTHNSALWESLGGVGHVYDSGSGQAYTRVQPEDVTRFRYDFNDALNVPVYEYALSGNTILLTRSQASVEIFRFDRPYATFEELDALFSGTQAVPFPDAWSVPVKWLALSTLAMTEGDQVALGNVAAQIAMEHLRNTGLQITVTDLPDRRRGEAS